MRILALTNLFPPHYLGGYELICHMVVKELRARGHDVQILTSDHVLSGTGSLREDQIERSLKIRVLWASMVEYLEAAKPGETQ